MADADDTRLAIVSDIHGNLTALEAVIADLERRGVDRVVHGGDLALTGSQGAEVVDRVRELGWPGIVGNTDELLWRGEVRQQQERAAPALKPLLAVLFEQYAPATQELLGEERIAWLRELPAEHREGDIALLHASPGNLWRAPAPDAEDEALADTYGECAAPTVIYGHIHRPYVRRVDRLTVINSGSVGSPFDGDPRASYVLFEGGAPQIVRVEYDVGRDADILARSGYPDAARIAEMRRQGAFLPLAGS